MPQRAVSEPVEGKDANEQRLDTVEDEVRLLRSRSHEYGNKLTEQGSHIEDARGDIQDLRFEMTRQFDDLRSKTDERFDKQDKKITTGFDAIGARFWKAAGLLIAAMGVAVAILR